MYGRDGMTQQLENLRDNSVTRDHLVKYLGHRAPGAAWKTVYKQSVQVYLGNPHDVALFGVLVRDVEPRDTDLRGRAKILATGCPNDTGIELVATYLPTGSISGIGKRIKLTKEGRHVGD